MADRRISEADPFQLNEVRGKLFKVPRAKYVEAAKSQTSNVTAQA